MHETWQNHGNGDVPAEAKQSKRKATKKREREIGLLDERYLGSEIRFDPIQMNGMGGIMNWESVD